jgi:hypothetical protein
MASTPIDIIGKAGDPTTQGLGRVVGQYVNSPKLIALLQGLYELGQDMDLLWQKLARMTSLTDDASQAAPNTSGAVGAQLRGIGNLVGVSNIVPGPTGNVTLTDAQYRLLIAARILRNHVRGGTLPQLIQAIQIVMPDLTTSSSLTITELGHMTLLVAVGREMQNWEAGIFAIPSGVNRVKGGLLPRPMGVALLTYWQNAGCFGFSSSTNPGVALFSGALGFNSSTSSTTGHWARSF